MIDFHCHLLPGLDDGPENIEESIEMAIALHKSGFKAVYCTPHMMKGVHEPGKEQIHSSLEALRQRLKKENINLKLFAGREYYLDEFMLEYFKEPMTLGDTKYIMMELPDHVPHDLIKETCFKIKRSGFTPMIAHPERANILSIAEPRNKSRFNFLKKERKTEKSDLLDYLISIECAFQGNYGSFMGVYGPRPQRKADILKKRGIYTHFGTDLHSRNGIRYLEKWTEEWKKR